jgi:uncharacterized protein YuzB (UPF0349 family)
LTSEVNVVTVIEYCLSNVDEETRRLLADRGETREATCLDHCGRCYRKPFLVIDGAVETGPSHEAILDRR